MLGCASMLEVSIPRKDLAEDPLALPEDLGFGFRASALGFRV